MIKTVNLKKVYTTEDVETTALNDVNLEIKEGEYVAIMGPSGCGKSTLLNVLGLIDQPSGGEYHFLGQEISKFSERKRAGLRKRNIGFVFQSFNLIDELTVYENVELPLLYLGFSAGRAPQAGHRGPREHGPDAPQGPFPPAALGRPAAARGRGPGRRRPAQAHPGRRADGEPGFRARRGGHEAPQRAPRERARPSSWSPTLPPTPTTPSASSTSSTGRSSPRTSRRAASPDGGRSAEPGACHAADRDARRDQVVFRRGGPDVRPPRHRPRRRRGGVPDGHGALGIRQIHPPPHPGPARLAVGRPVPVRRPGRPRAERESS